MAENDDEPIASCKFMDVKKEVPEWLAHRNKVLFSATHKKAAPSDESELEDTEDEEIVPTKGQDYDDEAARLFHNAGYSKESTSQLLKDSRISNGTSPAEDSFSDDSGVLPSSGGSSGWSTPLEADLSSSSIRGLEEEDSPLEEPPPEYYEQDLTGRSSEDPVQDNHSADYTEESYQTEETFEMVTVEDEAENPPPAESGNEKSTHSSASFWGNPARYGDPFREKDETGEQEKDESKDPPADMKESLHKNIDYSRTALNESGMEENPWMPPSHQQKEEITPPSEEKDDRNEGILSAFTNTIAETMKKLTGGDKPETSNQSPTSARVDFAGHTYSTTQNIRKYYDKGRNRNANEDMRVLYMPTRVPDIENPDTDEEELFDWVPKKYKTTKDKSPVVENGAVNSSEADDPYSADDENYVSAYTSDDENYKSTDDRIFTTEEEDEIESGYLSYEEQASYEGDAVETIYSEHKTARLSPNGTSETNDLTAVEPQDATTETKRKLFPCHCVHVCICLIIVLVPLVVFGIKYYPYWTSWLYNLFK